MSNFYRQGNGSLLDNNLMQFKSSKIMEPITFIKKQAKNLLKDYQTCENIELTQINNHFDAIDLLLYFEYPIDKDNFSFKLGNAQDLIAKMVGYKNWKDLICASKQELELAEFLLRRFKNSQDVQDWEETLEFSGLAQYGAETILDYARQYYERGEKQKIVYLPKERISILSGKERKEVLTQFDDEHNPAGTLRLDSIVYCKECRQSYEFSKSKVIKDTESNLSIAVCKNYPKCNCTYLEMKVLTPTILYGDYKIEQLKKGIKAFPRLTMDTKVHCLHCDQEYLFKEANVVISPDEDEPLIYCKNYPQCNGTLIDMIPVNKKNL